VPMEINLTAIGGFDESKSPFWKDLAHPAPSRTGGSFHLAAPAAGIIFQLSPGHVKGITDRQMKVLVRRLHVQTLHPLKLPDPLHPAVQRRLVFYHQFFTRHAEIDPDVVRIARAMVRVGRLDDHPTACRAAIISVQLFCFLLDPRLDLWRSLHISKSHLHWKYHWVTSPFVLTITTPAASNAIERIRINSGRRRQR